MKRLALLVAALAIVAASVAGFVSTALASSWTDLSDETLASYGITTDQVAQISQGFGNGLWRPEQQVTRGQFAKMTCLALGIAQKKPEVPTFADVPASNAFFGYIEGVAAVGIVNGVSVGHFAPSAYITREQGLAIMGRAVAQVTSTDLAKLYKTSQLFDWITAFSDGDAISSSLRLPVVFAANLGIVTPSEGALRPRDWLTRLEAAAFLIRAKAPTLGSVDPSSGGAAGGATVTLTGTGFLDVTQVKFGSTNATSFSVVSNTKMTAVVPAGKMGDTVDIVVTNHEGNSAVWQVTYTYTFGVPAVLSVSPAYGSPGGGGTVILTGSGFSGATGVQFGGTDATSFTVDSDTKITAVVPAGNPGATVSVTVIGPAGVSNDPPTSCSYIYGYPVVAAVDPDHGPSSGGTTVTITGTGFAWLSGADAVMFGSKAATSYQVVSDTKITAVSPAGEPGQGVAVTVKGSADTTVVGFRYDGPSITSISPEHGSFGGGNTVTISGTGLSDVAMVYFGSLPSPSVTAQSDTRVTAMVPAWEGLDTSQPKPVILTVKLTGGCLLTWTYYQYDVPAVKWLSDDADLTTPIPGAAALSTVVIHGIGFDCSAIVAVYFGPALATVTAVSSDKVWVTVPSGTPGSKVNVYVVNKYGSSTDSVSFTYP
jgi:hypothetical protein